MLKTGTSFLIIMAFRTVLIEKALNIKLDLNNIVVNYENEKFWINIDEISCIVVDDPRCNISIRLLSYLCEKDITIIFCNNSHMPIGTLQTLLSHSRASKKLKLQIEWEENIKDFLWSKIIENKIDSQKITLEKFDKKDKIKLLEDLSDNVSTGDKENREGTASRIYFKELFGNDFIRFEENIINYSLNYVYQIIRAKISQEIVSLGYDPSIGIHHKSEFNSFNLADDLIEPFRPICDYYVKKILDEDNYEVLTSELKCKITNILNENVKYNNSNYKIHSVIQFYIQNILSFFQLGDVNKIIFPKL